MRHFTTIAVTLLILLITGATAAQEIALPQESIPAGWSQSGEVREFAGAALYRHINGGSELYLDHGFQTLYVQDFAHESGEEIRLEIYVMDSETGAAGIMAANTRGLETTESYGEQASVDPYQILFITGSYYVSITCYSDGKVVAEGMPAIAGAAESHLSQLQK